MTRYTQIVFNDHDKELLKEVRACTGDWSTALDPIVRYRERLLDLQNYRCVYCQAPIEAEELGYQELEHILPKNKSSRCTPTSGTSNEAKKRRATLGYPEFTFEPLNLAVCCKQCNTKKGMHDALKDRTQKRPLQAYPPATELIWFHPHYDRYDVHIHIDDDFGFTGLTAGGRAVIAECGLDLSEVLEKKYVARAYRRARHADSVRKKVDALVSGIECLHFSRAQAVAALVNHKFIDLAAAEELIADRLAAKTALQIEAFYTKCDQYESRTDAP